MGTQEQLSQEKLQKKDFKKTLLFLIVVLVFSGSFYFIFLKKPKIPQGTTSYQTLNALVEKYADAKKEEEEKNIVYSLAGKLVRMSQEKDLITYEYDLGKGILLAPPEKISLPAKILPFEYFGKKIAKRQDLDLGKGELNLLSELKIWCQKITDATRPCQLSKWAVYSLPVLEKPDPYLEIAEKVLAWLEAQKNEQGVYYFGQLCRIDGQCETKPVDNRVGLAAIWGRFKNFSKTKNPLDLNIIRQDLQTYTDRTKVLALQNDFWNCKFMFDLWQSDTFSSEEKEKIEEICFSSNYTLFREIDDLVKAGNYQEKHDFLEVLSMKRFYTIAPTVISSFTSDMMHYAAYTSDEVARFLWKKDPQDLLRAKIYFDQAIGAYKAESENRYMRGRCVLGVAALDLYQGSSDSRYLDFATTLFEKEELDKTCLAEKEEIYPNRCQDSLFEQTTCALFASELFKLTKTAKYQVFEEKVITNLIDKSFDFSGYSGEFSGDGSFYSWGRGLKSEEVNISKGVQENGLIVGVLLE